MFKWNLEELNSSIIHIDLGLKFILSFRIEDRSFAVESFEIVKLFLPVFQFSIKRHKLIINDLKLTLEATEDLLSSITPGLFSIDQRL